MPDCIKVMAGETKHSQLVEQPPTDEQAGNLEYFLARMLDMERRQGRTELTELEDHIRFYIGALHEEGNSAIHSLMEKIDRQIASSIDPGQQRLHRIARHALASSEVERVTNVTYELIQAKTIEDIDIGFIYPDPAGRQN